MQLSATSLCGWWWWDNLRNTEVPVYVLTLKYICVYWWTRDKESTTPWLWLIDTCDSWGIKRFQTRRSLVWNRFIPHSSQVSIYHTKVLWITIISHESQVSIYHNQGVVDFLSRWSTKSIFQNKNTAISAWRSYPTVLVQIGKWRGVARGHAKDGFVVVQNTVCHLPKLKSYQYENISITIVQVAMYDILVSRIFCCVYLYAHKSRLNAKDELVT